MLHPPSQLLFLKTGFLKKSLNSYVFLAREHESPFRSYKFDVVPWKGTVPRMQPFTTSEILFLPRSIIAESYKKMTKTEMKCCLPSSICFPVNKKCFLFSGLNLLIKVMPITNKIPKFIFESFFRRMLRVTENIFFQTFSYVLYNLINFVCFKITFIIHIHFCPNNKLEIMLAIIQDCKA